MILVKKDITFQLDLDGLRLLKQLCTLARFSINQVRELDGRYETVAIRAGFDDVAGLDKAEAFIDEVLDL